jgi:hypothetical protein
VPDVKSYTLYAVASSPLSVSVEGADHCSEIDVLVEAILWHAPGAPGAVDWDIDELKAPSPAALVALTANV